MPPDQERRSQIETLLARQAAAVKYAEEYTLHAAPIRAILNPENET